MKLTRTEIAGIVSSLALVVLAGVFSLGQGVAHADVQAQDITSGVYGRLCEDGMIFFGGCVAQNPTDDEEDTEEDTSSDPCDLPGMSANPECSGGTTGPNPDPCDIFEQMGNLPPNCEGGNGGDGDGGGGGGGGSNDNACEDGIDNDADGLIDMLDSGCADGNDNDEADSGGGSGAGTMPQCRDSYDNDLDGFADANDPDCSDSEDNDESPTQTNSGGGGSSGGGGAYLETVIASTSASSTGSVLGSATTTPATSCDAYLTAFIKQGGENDAEQVKRLQYVLRNFESATISESGIYDDATLTAVHAFQNKYASEILAPWNIARSTGYVYLTTRKKVNEIYCKQQVLFPLSQEENMLIEETKATPVAPVVAKPKPAAAAQGAGSVKKPVDVPVQAGATTTKNESPVSRPWGSVGEFLRRLFNR